ncbi:MAG: hypothetical protein AB7N24_14615 [Dehalococcoidia bacterium]
MAEQERFSDVRDWIARFERRSFLQGVAKVGEEIVGSYAQLTLSDGRTLTIAHHFLARVALISSVYGRNHGQTPSRDDILLACAHWNQLEDPFAEIADGAAGVDDLHAVLIRTSWDQFPVQERPQDNIRIWYGIYLRALAEGILGPEFDELWSKTFGLPLDEWYRAALIYWLLVIAPSLPPEAMGLPPGTHGVGIASYFAVGELRARLDRFGVSGTNVEAAVRDLSQDYAELKARYERTKPADEMFERYAVNPLTSFPILRPDATHFVLPVARLFGNALGLATLYRLMANDGNFPSQFGKAFEHYVGETLRASFKTVLPEETYRDGKQEWSGFDWTVVEQEFALVIEVRSSRIPVDAKTSGDVEATIDGLKRAVSEPASKMPTKIEHIRKGLTKTPADILDRPVHRLIVTVENMHLESLYTELAGYDPKDPDAPIVVSIADLQNLLSVDGKTIHELVEEYQNQYVRMQTGSIGQWLRSHTVYDPLIGQHPVTQEDRVLPMPPKPPGIAADSERSKDE